MSKEVDYHTISPDFWNENQTKEFYRQFDVFKNVLFRYINLNQKINVIYGKILFLTPYLNFKQRQYLLNYNYDKNNAIRRGYQIYSSEYYDSTRNRKMFIEITLCCI